MNVRKQFIIEVSEMELREIVANHFRDEGYSKANAGGVSFDMGIRSKSYDRKHEGEAYMRQCIIKCEE